VTCTPAGEEAQAAERITIDPEALRRSGADLRTIGDELADTTGRVSLVTLGRSSFGLMNAAMVPQINDLARRSTTLVGEASGMFTRLGETAKAEATAWEQTERSHLRDIALLRAYLEAMTVGWEA